MGEGGLVGWGEGQGGNVPVEDFLFLLGADALVFE